MSRMHGKSVTAIAKPHGFQTELVAPSPGLFRARVRVGDIVRGGSVLGELELLGQLVELVVPEGAVGAIVELGERELARAPVGHGSVLVTIDPRAAAGVGATAATDAAASAQTTGLVFRAPTSGRFYGRSAPDKPPFVVAGAELAPGTTICLLEVMKTFHRVTYGGGGLPERAKVRQVLVADGADVNAGDPLLALE